MTHKELNKKLEVAEEIVNEIGPTLVEFFGTLYYLFKNIKKQKELKKQLKKKE